MSLYGRYVGINHEAIIDLRPGIKILKIDNILPQIPRYYFNFTDFSTVVTRFDETSILIAYFCIMFTF
jgi:hypothetical protein